MYNNIHTLVCCTYCACVIASHYKTSLDSCRISMEYIYNYNCIELHIGVYTYNHY